MQNITFDLSTLHEHGSAFFDYLKLRKRFFVDRLKWDIPHNENYEMDQYDNPTAHYSLCVHAGKVLGGTRVMPTTSTWGSHTYMLRDAHHGKLCGIPSEAMPSEIESPYVWEMSRLVISDELTTHEQRARCLSLIGDGLYRIAEQQDCREFMGISSVALIRALRQLGFPLDQAGEPYSDPDDGRKYTVMRMPVVHQTMQIAAE